MRGPFLRQKDPAAKLRNVFIFFLAITNTLFQVHSIYRVYNSYRELSRVLNLQHQDILSSNCGQLIHDCSDFLLLDHAADSYPIWVSFQGVDSGCSLAGCDLGCCCEV